MIFYGTEALRRVQKCWQHQLFAPKMDFLDTNSDYWKDLKMGNFQKGPGRSSGKVNFDVLIWFWEGQKSRYRFFKEKSIWRPLQAPKLQFLLPYYG